MGYLESWPWVVAVAGGIVAAVTDIRERKVYNWLTYPLCVGGLVYHAIFSGWGGLAASVAGLLFGFFIILIPCFMGGVGAGDVKLMAAIGAWLRVPDVIWVFIFAGLGIGVWSVGILWVRKMSLRAVREQIEGMVYRLMLLNQYVASGQTMQSHEGDRGRLVPFAVFIAAAVAVYGGLAYSEHLPHWIRSSA